MSYSATPDFRSNQLDGAWWRYAKPNGVVNVCTTTGAAFLATLRVSLGLNDTPTWDDDLQHALVHFSDTLNTSLPGAGWDSVRDHVAQDLASRVVSLLSVRLGLFAAYYYPHGERFDAISLLDSSILPLYGETLLPFVDGGSGLSDRLVCFDPNADPNPTAQSAADRAAAQDASTYGVRLSPGETPPSPVNVPAGPGGLSFFELAIAGAAFFGIVYLAAR